MRERLGEQFGNYRLTRPLGKGGFADVYLGEHIHIPNHWAAIKILHTSLTQEDAEKFRAEAGTLAYLVHPHIVRLLDFSVEGMIPYVVMDYAPNGSLLERHPRGTRLSLETVVSYVMQIVEALDYAHERRLVHRDIKPSNFLLGRRNEVLLGDFGIATLTQSARSRTLGGIAGTASYMAPEQFRGKPRRASDQYSLGIVVYEWLTGSVPFHGELYQLAIQHTSASPPPLREKVLSIPQAIEQVVLKALAKHPKERFASVREFAQALATAYTQAVQHASEPTIRDEPLELSVPLRAAPAPDPCAIPHKTVEQWLRKGNTHYNLKQYREAILAFNTAIELAPPYAPAYALRGQAHVALKEYRRAIKDFDQALKLAPHLEWVELER